MAINWNRLTDYFPEQDIEWRIGATTRDKSKGMALAYITARAVQNRLDEVFGPGGWKNEYRSGPEGGVICRIYFKNDESEWVWREDGAENTDIEAVKGGLSGALKRAASALGIGRYLYELPQSWVPLDGGVMRTPPRVPREFLPGAEGSLGAEASQGAEPPFGAERWFGAEGPQGKGDTAPLTKEEQEKLLLFAEKFGIGPDLDKILTAAGLPPAKKLEKRHKPLVAAAIRNTRR